ncbi:A-kinase-interacting protein 1 isoform X1 [Syngnathus scovelli]|uniref:A-kinase-interacting protein 1 isoform X1 n=1 Tax=Syngnathus scovelli TaxID=161590 RepID=UPI0021104041|nr:A-kinase-interacting protein 1 isoform X1 [Syngnathus scovelli]XP_049579718.1 A-kinase-interacting protein 1 isoform X1 [Syngnathus scovelli]
MATLAGLEYSLQKSARLGLELLDRASRRKVNWSKPPPTYASMAEIDKDLHKKTLAELQEAFASIIKFMAETHIQCKRFYDSVGCAQGSIIEREHVPRFHDHVRPTRNEYPPQYREHYSTSLWRDHQRSYGPESRSKGQLVRGSGSGIQPGRHTATNQDGCPR